MKLVKIFSHPIVVIALFCLTLVSGKHLGGVYLLYLLMAIPHGASYAMLAIAGIVLLLFGYYKKNRKPTAWVPLLMGLAGISCMVGSLYLFFQNSWEYNADTFSQPVPIFSYILFGLAALGYLFFPVISFLGRQAK